MMTMVKKYRAGICLVLVIFFFCGMGSAGVASSPASSPVTSPPEGNTIPAVSTSDVYTAPIGAFTTSDVYAEPNMTYDIDYLFYSRGYGPGTVTCRHGILRPWRRGSHTYMQDATEDLLSSQK
jgi:hypothetical protein